MFVDVEASQDDEEHLEEQPSGTSRNLYPTFNLTFAQDLKFLFRLFRRLYTLVKIIGKNSFPLQSDDMLRGLVIPGQLWQLLTAALILR